MKKYGKNVIKQEISLGVNPQLPLGMPLFGFILYKMYLYMWHFHGKSVIFSLDSADNSDLSLFGSFKTKIKYQFFPQNSSLHPC